jgi:CubicO group peptidase (beta-lactamase class C family)
VTSLGTVDPNYVPVVRAFRRLVGGRTGGGAFVARVRGETVADLTIGWADRARTRPWTPETVAISFSTTKGVASTILHRLADRGLIDYDEPVATYWPEFGAGGKERVTVRDLMSHRAGLWSVQAVARRAEDILDHHAMEEKLAARTVRAPTERSGYHAITYGWLVAGLARRVTGQGLADLARTEIVEPLGLTSGMQIGVPEDAREFVAQPVGPGLRQADSFGQFMRPLARRIRPGRATLEALHIDGFHRLFEGSEPPIWTTEMPAVNGALSAGALARMYGALANGGEEEGGRRLLSPETTDALGRVQVRAELLISGPIGAGAFVPSLELVDERTGATSGMIGDIRTVISGEAALQSAERGFY